MVVLKAVLSYFVLPMYMVSKVALFVHVHLPPPYAPCLLEVKCGPMTCLCW